MRIVLILAAACISVVCGASVEARAETQRQRHLPYVRAASDCIANAVRRDYAFPDAVQTDNYRPLIGRAFSTCSNELARMAAAHDQIYGGGGNEFLTVDYVNDVERAVRTRLEATIAETRSNLARAAEMRAAAEAKAKADRIEAENRAKTAQAEKLALAEKTQDLVRDRMFGCIGKESASMILTNETAEVVAKAAMVFCRSEVDAMSQVTMDVFEARSGEVGNRTIFRQQAETTVREIVTAYVVKARGAMLSSKSNPPTGNEQAAMPQKSF